MFTFVVVAARGNDLLELPILRDKYNEGVLIEGVGFGDASRRAVEITSVAAAPAAEILSLETCATGVAFELLGHERPYQLFPCSTLWIVKCERLFLGRAYSARSFGILRAYNLLVVDSLR